MCFVLEEGAVQCWHVPFTLCQDSNCVDLVRNGFSTPRVVGIGRSRQSTFHIVSHVNLQHELGNLTHDGLESTCLDI